MPLPRARILSTGSEILQGLYADTNAQIISRMLFSAGFRVVGHSAAPDDRVEIAAALATAMRDTDLIVMTGGLGPTEDDVNRDVISKLYEVPLQRDSAAESMMRKRFLTRGVHMPERNVVQAQLPAGCLPLYNHWGTAPGFVLPGRDERPVLVALPGPPNECIPMFERALENEINAVFPKRRRRAVHTLHIALTPESVVNQAVADLFENTAEQELTILASRGIIRLRIVASGENEAHLKERIEALRTKIVERTGPEVIFAEGEEDIPIARAVLQECQQRGATLALAESCTGGWVAKAITDIPGSSSTLRCGWVTYSNESKSRELGVDPQLVQDHGAVSEEVVIAMAEGARQKAGTDYAVAITGIAGPGGGTEEKPVGLVWFAVSGPDGTIARRRRFGGDREGIRLMATQQALELLRRTILGIDPDLYIGGPEPLKVAG